MVDLDTKYQNLEKEYECSNCGDTVSAPMHCGHPMHLEENEGYGVHWVCWMGIKCGEKDFEGCEETSIPIRESLGY